MRLTFTLSSKYFILAVCSVLARNGKIEWGRAKEGWRGVATYATLSVSCHEECTVVDRLAGGEWWTLCKCIYLLTSFYTYTFIQSYFSIHPCLALQVPAPAGGMTASPDRALHIRVFHVETVVLFFWYFNLFELGVEVTSYHWSAVAYFKVELLKCPCQSLCSEHTMEVFVMLIRICFFHLRNHPTLSVDRLNSDIYTICRDSLIAILSGHLPRNDPWKMTLGRALRGCTVSLYFHDWYCHIYFLCLLHQNFLAADS